MHQYVPMLGNAFSEDLNVRYSLLNEFIPEPYIGHKVNWEKVNGHLSKVLGDQRSCPAMMRREDIGITVRMPFTATFYRDGRIVATKLFGEDDHHEYAYFPQQSTGKILNRSERGIQEKPFLEFPACLMTLPTMMHSQVALGLFLLGDIRLNTWIIDAGVFLLDVPEDYAILITPVAHKEPPKGVILHEGVSESVPRIMGTLKVPVQIDFNAIPEDQESVVIERGEPLLSWILVKLPKVSLQKAQTHLQEEMCPHYRIMLSPAGTSSQLERLADGKFQLLQVKKDYRVGLSVNANEIAIMRVLRSPQKPMWTVSELFEEVGLNENELLKVIRRLRHTGLIQVFKGQEELPDELVSVEKWMSVSRVEAWDEVYRTGRYYRWVSTKHSHPLQSLLNVKCDQRIRFKAADLGCGIGTEAEYLAHHNFDVVGIDISQTVIGLARERYAGLPNIEWVAGDVRQMELTDNSFDFVNDRGCLQHMLGLKDQISWATEVHRILKPGGWLLVQGAYSENGVPGYASPTMQGTISNFINGLHEEKLKCLLHENFELHVVEKLPWENDRSVMQGLIVLARKKGEGSLLSFDAAQFLKYTLRGGGD